MFATYLQIVAFQRAAQHDHTCPKPDCRPPREPGEHEHQDVAERRLAGQTLEPDKGPCRRKAQDRTDDGARDQTNWPHSLTAGTIELKQCKRPPREGRPS